MLEASSGKDVYFNSRPCGRGDAARGVHNTAGNIFQFTPLREGRQTIDNVLLILNNISIHAPAGGATMQAAMAIQQLNPISIHAPAGGATNLALWILKMTIYFNSRPCGRGDGTVPTLSPQCTRFQFTPLREGRRLYISSQAYD